MNISEIAKLSKVSRATVSRYLNDGYVSEEKKQRIKKVIEETGYEPSLQAQTLRTKKTKLIGVILPKINSDTVARIVAGISVALSGSDFQIILADTENNEKKEIEHINLFKNRVDGIILIATSFTREHRKVFKELAIPFVIVGQKLEGYSCIYHDDFMAAKTLTDVLIKSGSKNIGYIGVSQKDKAVGVERLRGFKQSLKENKICFMEENFEEALFSIESGYEKAKELLEKSPNIDGIFCTTDNIAVGAMSYIKEVGKKIPKDIRIVGIGDSVISKVTTPDITTAHYHYKTSGIEAAKMILGKIQNEENMVKEIKLGYKVIERGSTKIIE